MSICLSWSGPGLLLLLLGQARCEVSGDECISSRLTGLGLSSGTSQPRYQQYQLRIAAARRSHFELVTATTELALGWCWSGQGRYTGGCSRWRSGHQIQTRDTEAALPSIAAGPAAWVETPPLQVPGPGAAAATHTHYQAQGQAAKASISSLRSSSSTSNFYNYSARLEEY